ncbi:MAG: 6-carboxytetrahydropterin synthase [Rhodothermales bacterium]|nr:6-carboxytetrahydropterin synthase [Rhodothermales bacterium]
MPNVNVIRRMQFNSAHRLHNPEKSDEWNAATFGKCNSPNWHGHNYVLEIGVVGEPSAETGYVIDLGELKKIANDRVIDKCDHKNLNLEVDFMRGVIPSTENFAIAIWNELADALPSGTLSLIRLYETENNWVEYRGE